MCLTNGSTYTAHPQVPCRGSEVGWTLCGVQIATTYNASEQQTSALLFLPCDCRSCAAVAGTVSASRIRAANDRTNSAITLANIPVNPLASFNNDAGSCALLTCTVWHASKMYDSPPCCSIVARALSGKHTEHDVPHDV